MVNSVAATISGATGKKLHAYGQPAVLAVDASGSVDARRFELQRRRLSALLFT